ncbi:MAG: hypothetical protein FRX48_01701 [Lasallia pustulata]|uniref:Uncharacterized protein n=1 Tax=Lasallia pustulata TaxID=136370 RepID=A0A5M8Q152_9LECA|nr:MAG: hypothetical protein FRX48_01701 [Lasallia pustulata]
MTSGGAAPPPPPPHNNKGNLPADKVVLPSADDEEEKGKGNEDLAEMLEDVEAGANPGALLRAVVGAIIELQEAAHHTTVPPTDYLDEGDSGAEEEGEEEGGKAAVVEAEEDEVMAAVVEGEEEAAM